VSLSQFYDIAKELVRNWQPETDVTVSGDVAFTGRTSTITIAGKDFRLPGIEAAIFKLLVQKAELVVPRQKLRQLGLAASREKGYRHFDRWKEPFLTNHICVLRRRLGVFRKRVVTVKGEGYRYSLSVQGPTTSFRSLCQSKALPGSGLF
jgi:DNA-binding winged helix-turn-helix (wHTH) protein